jgi:hypothetical protein|tara:strand:+ start:2347 stop:2565 length:219 start_codon:yes stop_codon:yes gene_type:complete
MKLLIEKNLRLNEFDAWSDAVQTKKIIIAHNKHTDFEELIEDIYPNGLTETKLNDILHFETEWIYKKLDIKK